MAGATGLATLMSAVANGSGEEAEELRVGGSVWIYTDEWVQREVTKVNPKSFRVEGIDRNPVEKGPIPEDSAPARIGATKMPEARDTNSF